MLLKRKIFFEPNLLFAFLLVFIILSSCAPTRRAAYFRVSEEVENIDAPDESYVNVEVENYIIKAEDELYITVISSDNNQNNFNTAQIGSSNIDLLSYVVDRDGYIKLPYTNRVKLGGKTIEDASKFLETELAQYLYQPVVTIKIVNARITVLGEVRSPGIFVLNNLSINIFQALGYAGDISTFGNRKKVLIVREENDIITKKYVDLTNDKLIESVWYTMKPNDIIYVEPLAGRAWGMETFPWDLVTSVISTTILIMTFMITLIN